MTHKKTKTKKITSKKRIKQNLQQHIITKIKKIILSNKLLLITFTIVIILDKFTKILVKHTYLPHESHNVIGTFFKFTFIENQGIAFGLFSEWAHPLKSILLLVLSVVALVFLINFYSKVKNKPIIQLSFGMIFGGAFGNIYDRLIYKRVVDFINLGIGDYRWPFFNIADSSITIGLVIIMILIFIKKENL